MKIFTFLMLGMLITGTLSAYDEQSLPIDGDYAINSYNSTGEQIFEALLEQSRLREKEREQYIKLCKACSQGDLALVKGFVEGEGTGVGYNAGAYERYSRDIVRKSPLVAAAGSFYSGPGADLDVVRYLLAKKADVNEMAEGVTPLSAAVNSSKVSVVQLLIQRKADLEKASYYNGTHFRTPLAQAIFERGPQQRVVGRLLEADADMGVVTECAYCPGTKGHTLNELFSCSRRSASSDLIRDGERDRQVRDILEGQSRKGFTQLMVSIPRFSADLVNVVATYLGFVFHKNTHLQRS